MSYSVEIDPGLLARAKEVLGPRDVDMLAKIPLSKTSYYNALQTGRLKPETVAKIERAIEKAGGGKPQATAAQVVNLPTVIPQPKRRGLYKKMVQAPFAESAKIQFIISVDPEDAALTRAHLAAIGFRFEERH